MKITSKIKDHVVSLASYLFTKLFHFKIQTALSGLSELQTRSYKLFPYKDRYYHLQKH